MSKGMVCALAMVMASMPAAAMASSGGNAGASSMAPDVYRAAQCVVRRDRGAAVRLFAALPIDAEPRLEEATRAVANAGCPALPSTANLPVLLRGALAQALLQSDFQEFGGEPHNVGRLVDLRLPVEGDGPAADEVALRYQWSDCVVRNDTANIEHLMRAPPGSERERRILSRMEPYMSACMEAQSQFGASAPELRSMFMQSTYHMFYRYWRGGLRAVPL